MVRDFLPLPKTRASARCEGVTREEDKDAQALLRDAQDLLRRCTQERQYLEVELEAARRQVASLRVGRRSFYAHVVQRKWPASLYASSSHAHYVRVKLDAAVEEERAASSLVEQLRSDVDNAAAEHTRRKMRQRQVRLQAILNLGGERAGALADLLEKIDQDSAEMRSVEGARDLVRSVLEMLAALDSTSRGSKLLLSKGHRAEPGRAVLTPLYETLLRLDGSLQGRAGKLVGPVASRVEHTRELLDKISSQIRDDGPAMGKLRGGSGELDLDLVVKVRGELEHLTTVLSRIRDARAQELQTLEGRCDEIEHSVSSPSNHLPGIEQHEH